MLTYHGRRNQRGGTTTHSKADALSEREFELLLDGARSLGDDSVQAVAAVLACGRLGLRSGELGHLDASWIDWQRSQIEIPSYDPCTKSAEGDPCGDCRQKARQAVGYADDLALEDALAACWTPKTEAAARAVPFGFATRVEIALERLVDEYGGWPLSVQTIYRRVTDAAEAAEDEVAADDVRPHGLRATAASYHAARGLETLPLQAMFGWAQLSTAEKYVASSSANTRRALNAIHSQ
jgi:integrase